MSTITVQMSSIYGVGEIVSYFGEEAVVVLNEDDHTGCHDFLTLVRPDGSTVKCMSYHVAPVEEPSPNAFRTAAIVQATLAAQKR